MWKIPYQVLMLMVADAPRYVTVEEEKKRIENEKKRKQIEAIEQLRKKRS